MYKRIANKMINSIFYRIIKSLLWFINILKGSEKNYTLKTKTNVKNLLTPGFRRSHFVIIPPVNDVVKL